MFAQIALIQVLKQLDSLVETVGDIDTIILVNIDPLRHEKSAPAYIT